MAVALDSAGRQKKFWAPPKDEDEPEPDIGDFTEKLYEFLPRGTEGVPEANKAMQSQKRSYDLLYAALLDSIRNARNDRVLTLEESQLLDDELAKVKQNADRLVATLDTHAHWQDLHDKMESLEGYRDTVLYRPRLKSFFANDRDLMVGLAKHTLEDQDERDDLRRELEVLARRLGEWSDLDDEDQFGAVRTASTKASTESTGPRSP